jgi:hypothetical protein
VAAILAGTYVTVGIDHLARISDDLESQVARLKADVVRGERLVSFGPLFHKFTFHYRDAIEIVPWPEADFAADPPWEYFCFLAYRERVHGKLPFAWEKVAVVYCDRGREKGANHVYVGRRVGRKSETAPSPRTEAAR